MFDILIFDADDEAGFDCYSNAVYNQEWDSECAFGEGTHVKLAQDSFTAALVGLDEISATNKRVIIDNTPLPVGGVQSDDTLSAMMTVSTDFEMGYNIKTLTIYAGLVSLLILFINLAIVYLFCKLKNDTANKRMKLIRDSGGEFGSDNDNSLGDE